MASAPVYHLRITLNKDHNAKDLWNEYKTRFNPKKYLVYFEISKKDVPHIHARIEYDRPSRQTLQDWFAKKNLKGKYHHDIERDKLKNELYIMKDGNMIDTNYPDNEMESLINKLEKIDLDKKKYLAHKIYERIKIPYDNCQVSNKEYSSLERTIEDQIEKIYVDEWDRMPPGQGVINQLKKYIIIKKKISRKNI